MADIPSQQETAKVPAEHLQGFQDELLPGQKGKGKGDGGSMQAIQLLESAKPLQPAKPLPHLPSSQVMAYTTDLTLSKDRPAASPASTVELGLKVFAGVPSAFFSELNKDVFDPARRRDTASRVVIGSGIGGVSTVMLRAFPRTGLAIGGVLLAKQGYDAISSAVGFADAAGNAKTEEERDALVKSTSHALGSGAAHVLEAAPGVVLGGYTATRMFGTPRLYSDLAYATGERFAFVGPGTGRLSGVTVSQGKIDAMALAERFAERHKFAGVEKGSTYNISTGKLSRVVSGTEDGLAGVPGASRQNVVVGHVHRESVGAHPGPEDIVATEGLGIISSGKNTAFYVGQRSQFKGLKGPEQSAFAPELRMVHINEAEGSAYRVVARLDGLGQKWVASERQALDYKATMQSLRNLDTKNPWQELARIRQALGR